ncbi:MAG: hypothetical protein BWY53_00683 [Parcubacteria group bacterium ADurb.Bin326]|nr:MAG: hypothetical protein BWY53_00683 [Parcubacteria group bacterium ADurb.Bin326]
MLSSKQLSVLKEFDYEIEKLCQEIMELREKIGGLEYDNGKMKEAIGYMELANEDLRGQLSEMNRR